MNKAVPLFLIAALTFKSYAQPSDQGTGAHLPSQAAADVIRRVADADGAFVAAGNVNASYDPKDLASLIQLPAEKIVVLNLKGSEIKQAFQRSVSLFPQSNISFLQISGFTVEFKGSGTPPTRV